MFRLRDHNAFAGRHQQVSQFPELQRRGDRELAGRSVRTAQMYSLLGALMLLFSDVRTDFPLAGAAFTLVLLLLGIARHRAARSLLNFYPEDPDRWRRQFVALSLAPGAIWTAGVALLHAAYGIGTPVFMALLGSAGIAAGAMVSLTPSAAAASACILIVLAPPALMFIGSGSPAAAGMACMILIYVVFLVSLARRFHVTYWTGLENSHLLTMRAEELEHAQREIVAANRAKSEFLSNMSHEIRTPLNGILGFTDLVLAGRLTADQRQSLEDVRTSARSLQGMLGDLLDFSQMETGRLEIASAPFSLRRMLRQALSPLEAEANTREIGLHLEIGHAVPDALIGDPERLQQVLHHILHNGVKFTSSGEVRLRVVLEGQRAGIAELRFEVTDTGVGIPAAEQARIFEAFRQADSSDTREFGGAGLGLALSSRLVGLMGGSIRMESEPDRGSTFQVFVPLELSDGGVATPTQRAVAPDRRASERPDADAPRPEDLGAATILVVEPEELHRNVICRLLRSWGFEAISIAEPGEAELALGTVSVDLLLLRHTFPDQENRHLLSGSTPALALVTPIEDAPPATLESEGYRDRICLPVDPIQLEHAVRYWVSMGRDQKHVPGQPGTGTEGRGAA